MLLFTVGAGKKRGILIHRRTALPHECLVLNVNYSLQNLKK
jgi:hypothetical protein